MAKSIARSVRRVRKDINIDPKLIKWVGGRIDEGVYWNFSHCVESLIKENMLMKDKMKEKVKKR
ncbi:MAG: hypothetical protein KKG60_00425 [Nanoarchaeota archaeon]|nr:hypothetical protein [Nanoarchaeota archaeon]